MPDPKNWYGYDHIVSILVFVELALDGKLGPGSIHRCFVSILVFVELALDAEERQ